MNINIIKNPFELTQEETYLDIKNKYKKISNISNTIEDHIEQFSFDIYRLNNRIKSMINKEFIIEDFNGAGTFSLHDLFISTLNDNKFVKLEFASRSFYLKSNWLNEAFKDFSFRVLETSNENNYQQRDNLSNEDHFFVQILSDVRNKEHKNFVIFIKNYIEQNLIFIQKNHHTEISEAINRTYYLIKLLKPIALYNKKNEDNPLDIKSIFTSYEPAPIKQYPELIKELENISPLLELSYDINISSQLKELNNNITLKNSNNKINKLTL